VKGDFLYVPQGGVHAFSNESGAPARMLILFAPGPPREEYFTELADIRSAGRTLTEQEWIEVWAATTSIPPDAPPRSAAVVSGPPGEPAGARGTGASSRDDAGEAARPW
jgi:hypothetical protein